jgi:hypothetical protein
MKLYNEIECREVYNTIINPLPTNCNNCITTAPFIMLGWCRHNLPREDEAICFLFIHILNFLSARFKKMKKQREEGKFVLTIGILHTWLLVEVKR